MSERPDLKQALGIEQALQSMLAHVAEGDTCRQISAYQFRRSDREKDLAAVRGGHDARGAIQHRAEIIAIPKLGRAGVQAHPYF